MAYSRSGVWPPRSLFAFSLLSLLFLKPKFFAVTAAEAEDSGRSELCNVDFHSFLPPPYSNLSNIFCKPIWNTFVLRYSQTEDHVVNIVLSAVYTTGWVGMGFSKDGMMVGSSCMVGWVGKGGRVKIKQYYVQGFNASEVIPNKGELPLTGIPAVVVLHEASIYLAFQLKFSVRLAHQPIILAFGSKNPIHNRLSIHDDKTTVMFDFSAGSAPLASHNIGRLKQNHGTLGIVGWGLVLPLGAIVARYFRHHDPLWYYLHTCIQFVGFLIVLAGVVVGQALYDRLHANIPAHRGIGIFALVLSILQVLAFFLRPNKDSKIRKYWNWYHHWFGRFALFFGALNIVLGIHFGAAGSQWKIGYGFLLGIVLIAIIVLEALSMIKSSQKAAQTPAFQMNPIRDI